MCGIVGTIGRTPVIPLILDVLKRLEYRGKIILLTDAPGASRASVRSVETIVLPKMPGWIAPIVYTLPPQFLACNTAAAKETNVDQPRSLGKSAAVE